MGYAVIQACDGGEAFDSHERERPHLVLIDLMMPEVNGFDVVVALQRCQTAISPGCASTSFKTVGMVFIFIFLVAFLFS